MLILLFFAVNYHKWTMVIVKIQIKSFIMKRTFFKRTFLLIACLSTLLGYAQTQVNVALDASVRSAHFTASWNNLNAINDGITGYGELGNTQTWGTWNQDRPESGWLVYEWSKEYTIIGSKVYFWTDTDNENAGNGVAVPSEWKVQYWDKTTEDWADVTLLDGESYSRDRLAPNAVSFSPITTDKIRLYMNAATDGSTYAALGVTEWEVYSQIAEPVVKTSVTQITLSDYLKSLTTATFNVKGVNIPEQGITLSLSNSLQGVQLSALNITKADAESENGGKSVRSCPPLANSK